VVVRVASQPGRQQCPAARKHSALASGRRPQARRLPGSESRSVEAGPGSAGLAFKFKFPGVREGLALASGPGATKIPDSDSRNILGTGSGGLCRGVCSILLSRPARAARVRVADSRTAVGTKLNSLRLSLRRDSEETFFGESSCNDGTTTH
jgi:hypothetical protein